MIRRNFTILLLTTVCSIVLNAQGSVQATYSAGDIPTAYLSYDPNCNGVNTTLQIVLPQGNQYEVTGIDITYDFEALNSGYTSDQFSRIKFQNTNTEEPSPFVGTGGTAGIQTYTRTNVNIANGIYNGGTTLIFEMHAWRTFGIETPACNTGNNRIKKNTWTIVVHYGAEIQPPKVGILTNSPQASLDVNGKIKMGDDAINPVAGTMRWNTTSQDFEGFNGTEWVSLTQSKGSSWGTTVYMENQSDTTSDHVVGDRLGYSMAMDGDYAVIGSPGYPAGGMPESGQVYIYHKMGNIWVEEAKISASDKASFDHFGHDVDIRNAQVIVGAPEKNASDGKAYIYKRTGVTWGNEQGLTHSYPPNYTSMFGYSVAIGDSFCVVGGSFIDGAGSLFQSSSEIFKNNNGTWVSHFYDDGGGRATAMSDLWICIGTPINPFNTVKMFIYNFGTWTNYVTLSASDFESTARFGAAIAIDGNYMVVGSPDKTVNGQVKQGQVYVFHFQGGTWVEEEILSAKDGLAQDGYGSSVDLFGDFMIVGAPYTANKKGRAYVYKRSGDQWQLVTTLVAGDGQNFQEFGNSVALGKNHIMVGTSFAEKIYFFNRN